jgi:hypothetical protein
MVSRSSWVVYKCAEEFYYGFFFELMTDGSSTEFYLLCVFFLSVLVLAPMELLMYFCSLFPSSTP